MKKNLVAMVALCLALTIALPAFAAVGFEYGGQFRTRWMMQNNLFDGQDSGNTGFDDHNNLVDTRLRLYFTFKASENLKLVTKFEVGDSTWGDVTNAKGVRVGADMVGVEVKNAYVDFALPGCGLRSTVGIQGIALMNAWIIDDDFAAAVVTGKFDPVKVSLGYIAAQNVPDPIRNDLGLSVGNAFNGTEDSIDDLYLTVDYVGGPLTANFVFFWQAAHDTAVSADPRTLTTPQTQPASGTTTPSTAVPATVVASAVGRDRPVARPISGIVPSPNLIRAFDSVDDNNLFDLGINVAWKADVWNAYLTFVKNLGSLEGNRPATPLLAPVRGDVDYTGWMLDGGVNYFCGPFTFNLGGFYTTGQEDNLTARGTDEIQFFTYPLATSKYFSEIMGGGIFDNDAPVHTDRHGNRDFQWRGYGFPTNLWTITVGGAWQVLEKTKVSASYWYFGSSQDVNAGFTVNPVTGVTTISKDNGIGHELNLYLTQGIVDGLTLDIVGAYLIADDALTAANRDDDIYEVGARIQWNF